MPNAKQVPQITTLPVHNPTESSTLSRKITLKLRRLVRDAMLTNKISSNAGLSKHLGISLRSVYNFMRKERVRPSLPLLIALAVKFNISFITLLTLAVPGAEDMIHQLALPSGIACGDSYRNLLRLNQQLGQYLEDHQDIDPGLISILNETNATVTTMNLELSQMERPDATFNALYAYWRLFPDDKRVAMQVLLNIPFETTDTAETELDFTS